VATVAVEVPVVAVEAVVLTLVMAAEVVIAFGGAMRAE
jgi:hypothetical protein